MNFGEIKKTDIANGPGVRVSLFVSGCTHHCEGCFNPETWDFGYGQAFTAETQEEVLQALAPDYIAGLTVLGGEPMETVNQRALLPLYRALKERYPVKTLWIYSGYTLEKDLFADQRAHCEATDEILSLADVLVDGEFVLAEKDLSLRFRGSRNQRLIDLQRSLSQKQVVLWDA